MDEFPTTRRCPACGAELRAVATACSACGRSEANPFVAPAAKDEPPPPGWPGPAYAVGVVCVAAALAWPVPGLAIAWVIIATPALVRAAVVIRRRRAAGLLISGADRATALFASVVATLLAVIAASIAFVAVCFPVGVVFSNSGSLAMAFVLGGIAALAGGVYMFWVLWPRNPTQPRPGNALPSDNPRQPTPPPSEGVS